MLGGEHLTPSPALFPGNPLDFADEGIQAMTNATVLGSTNSDGHTKLQAVSDYSWNCIVLKDVRLFVY